MQERDIHSYAIWKAKASNPPTNNEKELINNKPTDSTIAAENIIAKEDKKMIARVKILQHPSLKLIIVT